MEVELKILRSSMGQTRLKMSASEGQLSLSSLKTKLRGQMI